MKLAEKSFFPLATKNYLIQTNEFNPQSTAIDVNSTGIYILLKIGKNTKETPKFSDKILIRFEKFYLKSDGGLLQYNYTLRSS